MSTQKKQSSNKKLTKQTLKDIATDLKKFDFSSFDPRTDKALLMTHLQTINSKLGKVIRKLTEEAGER